jgi:hypothetical protein
VEAVPRRNRNLRVTLASGGLFLKQPEALADGSRQTLRAEGDFYRRHARPGSPLATALPRLPLHEPDSALLVLELLSEHETLTERCRSLAPPRFPIGAWSARTRSTPTRRSATAPAA